MRRYFICPEPGSACNALNEPLSYINDRGITTVTTVGTETDVAGLLTDLIQLDFDAADAYQAAIGRLDNAVWCATLARFREDYLRHMVEFGDELRDLGVIPPSGGNIKSMLTQGKVLLAGLVGDEAILRAMRTNEAYTNSAYERAVRFPGLGVRLREMLEAALADERRHCTWILDQLE